MYEKLDFLQIEILQRGLKSIYKKYDNEVTGKQQINEFIESFYDDDVLNLDEYYYFKEWARDLI